MKIGLFGGSFDPIHRGHLGPVREALNTLGLDRVIYLPTALPPHKQERDLAPPLARFAMVELALVREAGLYASPVELTPGRPCFTADTVAHFRRTMPGAELHLLLGGDSFATFDRWRRWREIASLASLAVLARPGWDLAALPEGPAELVRSGRARILDQAPVDVSSTHLRRLLAGGQQVPAEWLPDLVLDYIAKYDLYRVDEGQEETPP